MKKKTKKKDIIQHLSKVLSYAEQEHCLHEDTYRGGAIWEICRQCDMKWADEMGCKPEDAHEFPKVLKDARVFLSNARKRVLR